LAHFSLKLVHYYRNRRGVTPPCRYAPDITRPEKLKFIVADISHNYLKVVADISHNYLQYISKTILTHKHLARRKFDNSVKPWIGMRFGNMCVLPEMLLRWLVLPHELLERLYWRTDIEYNILKWMLIFSRGWFQ